MSLSAAKMDPLIHESQEADATPVREPVKNAITVDVEEWFHVSLFRGFISPRDWPSLESSVQTNVAITLDLFERAKVHGTFYIVGWLAERYPDMVQEIKKRGHEIGSHGYSHTIIYEQSRDEFSEDLQRSIGLLREITREPVVHYRAPSYSITKSNLWAWEVLISSGIKYDSSVFPIKHDVYGIPSAPRFPFSVSVNGGRLIEFPLSTVRLFRKNIPIAGGAYLRLYPLRFIISAIRKINEKGRAVILYFHPWELDVDQPRQKVPLATYLRHYTNIDTMREKLERLLSEFEFGPVGEVLERMDPAPYWPT